MQRFKFIASRLFLYMLAVGIGYMARSFTLDAAGAAYLAGLGMGGFLWSESGSRRLMCVGICLTGVGAFRPAWTMGWYVGILSFVAVGLWLSWKDMPAPVTEDTKMRQKCPHCERTVAVFEGRKPTSTGTGNALTRYFYRHTCLGGEQRSWVEAPKLGLVEQEPHASA